MFYNQILFFKHDDENLRNLESNCFWIVQIECTVNFSIKVRNVEVKFMSPNIIIIERIKL